MRKRNGCLIGIIGLVVACLIVVLAFWFVILPRAQNATADQFEDAAYAETVAMIDAGGTDAGTLVLNEAELSARLQVVVEGRTGSAVDTVSIDFAPDQFDVKVSIDAIELGYTGQITATDGVIEVENVEAYGSGVSLFVPADDLGEALETGMNLALAERGFQATTATMTEDALIVELADPATSSIETP